MRPVEDVLADVAYDRFPHWWQRKVVWFWDDNLTINRPYIKELLARMVPLRRWWLTQASLDVAKDDELLDLMEASGCIGIFFGLETFTAESLATPQEAKPGAWYSEAIAKLHRRGIAVMAGFIAGFDGDTPRASNGWRTTSTPSPSTCLPERLDAFKGTPLYEEMVGDGRMLPSAVGSSTTATTSRSGRAR